MPKDEYEQPNTAAQNRPEDEGPGLLKAEHIADHWHQRFLLLRDEEPKGSGRWNRLDLNADGAAHVLAEIEAERKRIAAALGSSDHTTDK